MDLNRIMCINIVSGIISLTSLERILQISLLIISVLLSIVKCWEMVMNVYYRQKNESKSTEQL